LGFSFFVKRQGISTHLYQFAIKRQFFVGANLVFALNVQGEHKVRPYEKRLLIANWY
jgi:hypothetical protein